MQGIYIYQFNGPLYFASAGVFRSRLYIETCVNPGELGMQGRRQGCFQKCGESVCRITHSHKPYRDLVMSTVVSTLDFNHTFQLASS